MNGRGYTFLLRVSFAGSYPSMPMGAPSENKLCGQLVFSQAGARVPLHNMRLEVRPKALTGFGSPIEATTDMVGRFEVAVAAGTTHLEIVVLDVAHRYDKNGALVETPFGVTSVALEVPSAAGSAPTDLGVIAIRFWPYRCEFPAPRAAAPDKTPPQTYTSGFMHSLELAFARRVPETLDVKLRLLAEGERLSLAEIQRHYPPMLTAKIEREHPGRTRSDAWLGDQLLNGFDVALNVGRDATDPSRFRVAIRWPLGASKTDGGSTFDMTNVDVTLEDRGSEVCASRILLEVNTPDGQGSWLPAQKLDVAPGDQNWEAAKRVVRCQYLLHGAIEGHIAETHFQTEQHAVAIYRNVRKNPIRQLLAPHLQEIVAQGADGDNFAWGPNGILVTQSALKPSDLDARFERSAGRRCYATFSPRKPVHATHRYAKAAALYWELLTEYVGSFFDEHRQAIETEWREIVHLSDDLVRHSPPYRPEAQDPDVLPCDRNEGDQPDVPRARVEGVVRSVRPITQSQTPAPGEMDKLLSFCRYVLYQATFNHTWTHDGQTDISGELEYATFGLQKGSIGPADSKELTPSAKVLADSLSFNALGMYATYGRLLADEEHDVAPALKSALLARREAFAALGVDISTLRSRINL